MTGDNSELPDHKPEPPHDRVVILATFALGAWLVSFGHLTAEGVVAFLGALGLFYRGLRE